jgi:hypothetical protein
MTAGVKGSSAATTESVVAHMYNYVLSFAIRAPLCSFYSLRRSMRPFWLASSIVLI